MWWSTLPGRAPSAWMRTPRSIWCEAGLVEASGEEVADGRLRRYYRLTDQGSTAVVMETARLRALTHRARTVLGAHLAFAGS